jgi:hypothetical protein
MIIRIVTLLLAVGWYLYVYLHYYRQMFGRMSDGGSALVFLSIAIFLIPYILGCVRQIIRPRPPNWVSFAESIILISSELYIVISFWIGTNDGDVDIGFDTAKLIQASAFSLVIITEYLVVKICQRSNLKIN